MTRLGIYSLLIVAGILILSSAGCKDEVVPAQGSKERVLTVLAKEVDPATGAVIGPARRAQIVIYEVRADGDHELARLETNDQGVAVYSAVFPAAGVNLRVVGTYESERQTTDPPVFLFCNDATVTLRFAGTWPVCCPSDTLLTYQFIDETGSTDLIQGNPPGIAQYTLTRTLFLLDCPNPNDRLTVTVPAAPAPFSIREMRVNDRDVTGPNVTIANGEAFTITFAVSTAAAGDYEGVMDLIVLCPDGATTHTVRVRLIATVTAFTCTCPRDSMIALEPGVQDVEVGSTRDYTNLIVYTNPANCRALTIDSVVSRDRERAWDVLAPSGGEVVQPGANIRLTARFRPFKAGNAVDTFRVYFRLADGTPCRVITTLRGFGCRSMCPLLLRPGNQEFNAAKPVRVDFGTVPFSPNAACGGMRSAVYQEVTLLLPDTACCPSPADVRIEVIDNDARRVPSSLYDVTPGSSIRLEKGVRSSVTVRFNTPTIDEFEALFASGRRVRTGTAADNEFNMQIRLSSPGCGNCVQLLDVRASVGSFINISNVITLYAYGQNTPKLPEPPVRKVCHIDCCTNLDGSLDIGRLFNMLQPVTKTFPYPPNEHDFFVEVMDTTSVRVPPGSQKLQDPMLFRVASSEFTRLIRFATNYNENEFADVRLIVQRVQNALNAGPNFFSQNLLNWDFPPTASSVKPRPGDVFIMASSGTWTSATTGHVIPCKVALLYIRKIFDGNLNNSSNDQSGIEYELIFPVILY